MSKRKFLSLLVVFALVFSLMAPAFAATPTDVIGTEYEGSVGKLNALGILAGYPDGTFQPEKSITRAEFSKVAVYVLGIQDAANLAKGETKFKDVKGTHWASGVINIAADKGLLKGYPDGTFKPEKDVSYSEAITILVRALGLGPVVEGKGTWPANYLSKASEVGITDDVAGLEGNAPALRGNIAKLAWNTLIGEKWGPSKYDANGAVEYAGTGKTILADKYKDFVDANGNAKLIEDAKVTATQLAGGLDANDISYVEEDGTQVNNVEIIAEGVDANALLGKTVDMLLGKDDKIAFITVTSEPSIEGSITEEDITLTASGHNGKIEIGSKEYSLAQQAKMYLNTANLSATGTDSQKNDNNGEALNGLDYIKSAIGLSTAEVTAVTNDNGLIETLNIFVADSITVNGITVNQFVVKEITAKNEVKDVKNNTAQFDIDVVTDAEKTNGNTAVIVKNGNTATGSDIEVGDVVTYIQNGTLYYIVVTDNQVTGTISKISDDTQGASASTRKALTINGTIYEMTNDASAIMSKSGSDSDIEAIGSTIVDFYNKEATLSLNSIGEVIYVNGSVNASAQGSYGIVTKAVWEGNPDANGDTTKYIQIMTTSGEKKAYAVKDDVYMQANAATLANATEIDPIAAGDLPVGTVVRYSVSSDGSISGENLYQIGTTSISDSSRETYVAYLSGARTVNEDAMTLASGGTTYYANGSTVFMNKDTDGTDNIATIAGWSKLVSGNTDPENLLDDGAIYVVYDKNKIVQLVIVDINTDVDSLFGASDNYGVYVEQYATDEDNYIVVNVNGEEKTYVVANSVYDVNVAAANGSSIYVEKGDFIKFNIDGNGEFDGGANAAAKWANLIADSSEIAEAEADANKIEKMNVADRIVTFADDSSLKLDSDVVVYDVRDGEIQIATINDLEVGQYVVAEDNSENGMYNFIVIIE